MKKILVFLLAIQCINAHELDSLSNFSTKVPKLSTFEKASFLDDDCDACGCSASGGSMGFASMLNPNFIGLRYFNQSYKSTDGLYSNSPWYNENFNTIQLWSRIPILPKWQATVLAPYHFHNRETGSGKQDLSGIGDVSVMILYQLFTTKNDSLSFKHNVNLGGGLKLPTGTYDALNNGSFNPSYQLGTGSLDYITALEYIITKNKWGINSMLNYIVKTENNKDYRFGNQFNYASTLFYLQTINEFSLVPQLGFAGEVYEQNIQLGQRVRKTEGDILFGKVGVELGKNNWSLGLQAMLPIAQNLNDGNVEANYRWSLNLNYTL
jgi:hypothetical protein